MKSKPGDARHELDAVEQRGSNWIIRFANQREAFEERGLGAWIPNLCPGLDSFGAAIGRLGSKLESGPAAGVARSTDPVQGTAPRAEERPVFVFGCSLRCGGTLLQRVLSSTSELFVWGENDGIASGLASLHASGVADTDSLRTFFLDYYCLQQCHL